jgi:molecular chaperone GrpE (heat shock protein)
MTADTGSTSEQALGIRASQELNRRLDELTDLFRRRLLDDRDKARAIAALQSELAHSRDGVRRQVLEPIMRQLILVRDRIDNHTAVTEEPSDFLRSLGDEISEVLAQYGVARVDRFDRFDPALAESVGTRPTEDRDLDGTVATVERPAYIWSSVLLRPAAVTLWRVAECPTG